MTKPEKRCGASLPFEKAEDGWYWCNKEAGHAGLHKVGPDPWITWEDGAVVEVYSVLEVQAVPHHEHGFVGDEDTCVRDIGCQLTWGEFKAQNSTWRGASADYEIRDEIQQYTPQEGDNDDD